MYDLARERNVRFSAALAMLRADANLIEARNRQRLVDDLAQIDALLDELEPMLDEELPEAWLLSSSGSWTEMTLPTSSMCCLP